MTKTDYIVTDNDYTSTALANTLQERGIHLLGTLRMNRQGIPDQLKADTKVFEKHAERGTMRYMRDDDILYQQ